jgi:hypothetical protein
MNLRILPILTVIGIGIVATSYNACTPVRFSMGIFDQPLSEGQLEKSVLAETSQLDILLIVDNSTSMLSDNRKLALRMDGFVESLQKSKVDWQMCVTTTSNSMPSDSIPLAGDATLWGGSIYWQGYASAESKPWILKSGPSDMRSIFEQTIEHIGVADDAGDERGIKAAYHHFMYRNVNNCYRPGAKLALIIISDEDEATFGGDQIQKNDLLAKMKDPTSALYNSAYDSQSPQFDEVALNNFIKLFDLTDKDSPQFYLEAVNQEFIGKDVKIHALVDSDSACKEIQDNTPDENGYLSISYIGKVYMSAAELTGGGVGSICEGDFSSALNVFKDISLNSVKTAELECEPNANSLVVRYEGGGNYSTSIDGRKLHFEPSLPEGVRAQIRYFCN